MPVTHHVKPEKGDVLLLVGTMKGAFILRASESRKKWEIGGPYFPGSAVYAMAVPEEEPWRQVIRRVTTPQGTARRTG